MKEERARIARRLAQEKELGQGRDETGGYRKPKQSSQASSNKSSGNMPSDVKRSSSSKGDSSSSHGHSHRHRHRNETAFKNSTRSNGSPRNDPYSNTTDSYPDATANTHNGDSDRIPRKSASMLTLSGFRGRRTQSSQQQSTSSSSPSSPNLQLKHNTGNGGGYIYQRGTGAGASATTPTSATVNPTTAEGHYDGTEDTNNLYYLSDSSSVVSRDNEGKRKHLQNRGTAKTSVAAPVVESRRRPQPQSHPQLQLRSQFENEFQSQYNNPMNSSSTTLTPTRANFLKRSSVIELSSSTLSPSSAYFQSQQETKAARRMSTPLTSSSSPTVPWFDTQYQYHQGGARTGAGEFGPTPNSATSFYTAQTSYPVGPSPTTPSIPTYRANNKNRPVSDINLSSTGYSPFYKSNNDFSASATTLPGTPTTSTGGGGGGAPITPAAPTTAAIPFSSLAFTNTNSGSTRNTTTNLETTAQSSQASSRYYEARDHNSFVGRQNHHHHLHLHHQQQLQQKQQPKVQSYLSRKLSILVGH